MFCRKQNTDRSLAEEVLKLQTTNSTTNYGKEDAYKTLDRVNFWLNSFDAKAYYLLFFIGIFGTILFTSGYFEERNLQVWNSLKTGLLNILFLLVLICYLVTSVCLVLCIKPSIKNRKLPKSAINQHTILFYGSIADMRDSKEMSIITQYSDQTIINDINNQSFVCSRICMMKAFCLFLGIYGILFCFILLVMSEIVKSVI